MPKSKIGQDEKSLNYERKKSRAKFCRQRLNASFDFLHEVLGDKKKNEDRSRTIRKAAHAIKQLQHRLVENGIESSIPILNIDRILSMEDHQAGNAGCRENYPTQINNGKGQNQASTKPPVPIPSSASKSSQVPQQTAAPFAGSFPTVAPFLLASMMSALPTPYHLGGHTLPHLQPKESGQYQEPKASSKQAKELFCKTASIGAETSVLKEKSSSSQARRTVRRMPAKSCSPPSTKRYQEAGFESSEMQQITGHQPQDLMPTSLLNCGLQLVGSKKKEESSVLAVEAIDEVDFDTITNQEFVTELPISPTITGMSPEVFDQVSSPEFLENDGPLVFSQQKASKTKLKQNPELVDHKFKGDIMLGDWWPLSEPAIDDLLWYLDKDPGASSSPVIQQLPRTTGTPMPTIALDSSVPRKSDLKTIRQQKRCFKSFSPHQDSGEKRCFAIRRVLVDILGFVDPESLLLAQSVNKEFSSISIENELWKDLCKKRFGRKAEEHERTGAPGEDQALYFSLSNCNQPPSFPFLDPKSLGLLVASCAGGCSPPFLSSKSGARGVQVWAGLFQRQRSNGQTLRAVHQRTKPNGYADFTSALEVPEMRILIQNISPHKIHIHAGSFGIRNVNSNMFLEVTEVPTIKDDRLSSVILAASPSCSSKPGQKLKFLSGPLELAIFEVALVSVYFLAPGCSHEDQFLEQCKTLQFQVSVMSGDKLSKSNTGTLQPYSSSQEKQSIEATFFKPHSTFQNKKANA